MSIHRDEIGRILYEETQLLDLYGNELHDAIAGHLLRTLQSSRPMLTTA